MIRSGAALWVVDKAALGAGCIRLLMIRFLEGLEMEDVEGWGWVVTEMRRRERGMIPLAPGTDRRGVVWEDRRIHLGGSEATISSEEGGGDVLMLYDL